MSAQALQPIASKKIESLSPYHFKTVQIEARSRRNLLRMKMKIGFLALFLVSLDLRAEGTAPIPTSLAESAASWTVTTAVVSHYMFRGALLGGASFQPSIEYDRGALGLGIWSSLPLKDKIPGQSDPELDLYGFYVIDFTKDLSIVPGFSLYTCPNAKTSDGFFRATFEPNIAFTYTLLGIKLTPKLYYDFVTKGPAAELTTAFALPLTAWGSELDFTGTIGTFKAENYIAEADPAVKNWGDYYLVGVSAPFKTGKDSTLTISWSYSAGRNNYLKQGTDAKIVNADAVGRGVVTVSYTVSF